MIMKKVTTTLFALLLTLGAMAQCDFMEDKVKVLYRWHTEFPEGSKNTQYAFYDVDNDGTVECMVRDESGHKGMFWYSGVIIRFQFLGMNDTEVRFWPRHIVGDQVIVMKGSRIVPKSFTPEKTDKIIARLQKKPAITWDDLDWQPLRLE